MSDEVKWRVPFSRPELGDGEADAALRVLRSGWLTMGPETLALEREFAAMLGARHAVAVASGTAALHLAYVALGVQSGCEVVQPAINFVAAANMTVAVGAKPVFVDICGLDEPTVDPDAIREAMTPRTRAVVVMHYGGWPARVEQIAELCRERGIALIEDACHAVDCRVDDRALGTWGDAGCFSFFSTKNMTAGEGGMVVTDRDDVAERVRKLRSHGISAGTYERWQTGSHSYDVVAHGYNYRLDEVRAALGRAQLDRLSRSNELRWEHIERYRQRLRAARPEISVVFGADAGPRASHLMAIRVAAEFRSAVVAACRDAGVQTSLHYPCAADFTVFAGRPQGSGAADGPPLTLSRAFAEQVITLPLFPSLEPEDIDYVCNAVAASLRSSSEVLAS